jgi:hypothetical protein
MEIPGEMADLLGVREPVEARNLSEQFFEGHISSS